MAVKDSNTKYCSKCGEVKPREAFSKDANKRDGLQTYCKPCRNHAFSLWYASNREKAIASSAVWAAANADRVKANWASYREANREKRRAYQAAYYAENPDKANASTAAWRAANKDKVRAVKAAWSAANREKRKAAIATWRKANPEANSVYCQNRRARKQDAGGTLSRGLAERLFKLQRGKCACCGKPLGDDYHLDHIMPLALGGSNTDDNIQLLRSECNLTKNAKHPVDYMQSKGFLL